MTRSSFALAALSLALTAAPAAAVTNTFDGTTDNDWNKTTNWSLGHVPTGTEDVVINVSGKSPSRAPTESPPASRSATGTSSP